MRRKDKIDIDALASEIEAEILEEERKIYTGRTIEEAKNPKNIGKIKGANAIGKITGPCGDTMQIFLKIKNGRILESKFLTDGCGPSIACGSVVTELVKDRSIEEALKIRDKNVLSILGGLPEENLHCSILAVDTLMAAVKDYRNREKR
jgi:nitrogen fixation NifU-like protein